MKKEDKLLQELRFEITFYERLVSGKQNFADALIPLANAYTRVGLYEKGLEIDKRLAKLKPNDETIHYNLACSYSLLGITDKALEALEKSFQLGYRDLNHLRKDKDLNNLKNDARFAKLLEKHFRAKT